MDTLYEISDTADLKRAEDYNGGSASNNAVYVPRGLVQGTDETDESETRYPLIANEILWFWYCPRTDGKQQRGAS